MLKVVKETMEREKVKEIRKMTYEQIGDRNKIIEIIRKKKQVKILKLRSKVVKMKNSLEELKSRYKQASKRIANLKVEQLELPGLRSRKKRMTRKEWT